MPKQQAVLSPEVAIDTKACQVRSFAIPYAVQIIEHRMWLSAVSDWPFQGCTVAFTLTKKSLCGEWLALWLLEIVKKDLRKQFASCSRRLSCFWALKPLLSTIYLYMCMYRCIYTQILCVWGTRTLCTSPSFFFQFSVLLSFVLWQQMKITKCLNMTSLTVLVLVLFWLGNTSIFWILTVLLLSISIK